jgi:sialidase-1
MVPFLLFLGLAYSATEIEQVDLFEKGTGGVHTYRIPALIETRKGTLLAVADARHNNTRDLPGKISLVLRRSTDRGRTWSPMQTLRAVPEAVGGVGDASLLLDRDTGRIWCFHAFGLPGVGFFESTPANRLQVHAIFSDDDGVHWSAALNLTSQIYQPGFHGVFVTSGTLLQTRKGRMLLPLVVRDSAAKTMHARNAYSDDHGRTWKVGEAIGPGTDENHNVEMPDGMIVQNMRPAKGGFRLTARSTDGGVTFGPVAEDRALPDPSCNAGIVRHSKKGWLLFTNAASSAKRERMTIRASRDEGKSWDWSQVLHEGPAAYSTVIVLRDGSVGVLYERGEKDAVERITFARLLLPLLKPLLKP